MSSVSVSTVRPIKARTSSSARTKLDRAQRAIELEKLERARKEEANKAPRFSAQHKFVLIAVLAMAAFTAAASFATSFTGLYGAAAWAIGDASPVLRTAAPCMLDVAILAFTIKLFVDRERGEKVFWTWFWIAVLAAVSSGSNVLHTFSVTTASTVEQLTTGAVISGSAPFLLALVVDVTGNLVFKKPEVES